MRGKSKGIKFFTIFFVLFCTSVFCRHQIFDGFRYDGKCEVYKAEKKVTLKRECGSDAYRFARTPKQSNQHTDFGCFFLPNFLVIGDHARSYQCGVYEDYANWVVYEIPENQNELDRVIGDVQKTMKKNGIIVLYLLVGLQTPLDIRRNLRAYAPLSLQERKNLFKRDHEYTDDTFVHTKWAPNEPTNRQGLEYNTIRNRAAFMVTHDGRNYGNLLHGRLYAVDDLKFIIDHFLVKEYGYPWYQVGATTLCPTFVTQTEESYLDFSYKSKY